MVRGMLEWARYDNVCLQQPNAGGFSVISHIRNKMTPPLVYRLSVTDIAFRHAVAMLPLVYLEDTGDEEDTLHGG